MRYRPLLPLASTASLAACTVGPNYHPATPAALGVPAACSVAGDTRPADLTAWWKTFDDPLFASTVERARANNLDLAQSLARLRQAREALVRSRAQLLPTLSGSAGDTRSQRIRGGTTTAARRHGDQHRRRVARSLARTRCPISGRPVRRGASRSA